jgi:proteasome lid subunit RPN8/RPN11
MSEHARKTFPNECCGLFFGSSSDDDKHVESSFEVTNSKKGNQRRRFEISPDDYMQGEAYADQKNTLFAGVYHSHPKHPAVPSEHDRKQAVPFFSYIILSVDENKVQDIKSWKLNEEGTFIEEEVKIVELKKL